MEPTKQEWAEGRDIYAGVPERVESAFDEYDEAMDSASGYIDGREGARIQFIERCAQDRRRHERTGSPGRRDIDRVKGG